jgi:hypothetical protein
VCPFDQNWTNFNTRPEFPFEKRLKSAYCENMQFGLLVDQSLKRVEHLKNKIVNFNKHAIKSVWAHRTLYVMTFSRALSNAEQNPGKKERK